MHSAAGSRSGGIAAATNKETATNAPRPSAAPQGAGIRASTRRMLARVFMTPNVGANRPATVGRRRARMK